MIDGIYQITFRGAVDWGIGILHLKDEVITGADVGGVLYDGVYSGQGEKFKFDLTCTVPPGVSLVQGTPPQSNEYSFKFSLDLAKKDLESQQPVLIQLPPGPVNVIFKRLR